MSTTNLYIKSVLGQDPIVISNTPQEIIIGINVENLVTNLNIAETTLESMGTGVNIVIQGAGPDLQIASVASGDGTIEVALFDNTLLLNVNTDYVNAVAGNVSLTSEGTGLSLVVVENGPDMSIASIDATGAASVSLVDNTLIVDVPNVSVVSANADGINVYYDTDGQEIQFRPIQGSDNVIVDTTADGTAIVIDVNVDALDDRYNVSLESVGSGASIVAGGVGPVLQVFALAGTALVDVTANVDAQALEFSLNLEALNSYYEVTLDNVGSGESAIYNGQGPDLVIKTFAGDEYITVNSNIESTTLVFQANLEALDARYNVNISSLGDGADFIVDGEGPEMTLRTLVSDTPLVIIEANVDTNTVNVNLNVELLNANYAVTLDSYGSGTSIVAQSQGPNLAVYTINAGPMIDVGLNLDINAVVVGANVEQIQNLIDNTVANVQLVSVGTGVSLVFDDGDAFNLTPGNMNLLDLIELSPEASSVPNSYSIIASGSGPSLSLMNVAVSEGTMTVVRDEGAGTLYLAALSEFVESETSLAAVTVDDYITAGSTWWLASGLPGSDSFGGFVRWIPSGTATTVFDGTFANAGHFENSKQKTRLRIRAAFYIPSAVVAALDETHYIQIVVAGSSVDTSSANSSVLSQKTFKMMAAGTDLVAVDTGNGVCPVYFELCEDATYVFVGVRHNLPGNIGIANETTTIDNPSNYGGISAVQGGVRVHVDSYSADPTL